MSFVEWSSTVPGLHIEPVKPHSSSYYSTITVSALSDSHSPEERTRHIEQSTMTGRRIWKTMKGHNGEAVWPPNLEAALLEGLKKYHQQTWRPALDRFPMRNRFISDYIYEATGKRRTAKQVGSRLQQLKDTCRQEKILRFLQPPTEFAFDEIADERTPGDTTPDHVASKPAKYGSSPSLTYSPYPRPRTTRNSPSFRHSNVPSTTYREELLQGMVDVRFLLGEGPWIPTASFAQSTPSDPMFVHLSSQNHYLSLRSTPYLTVIDPTIALISPCPLFPHTTCRIFLEGYEGPIYCEQVLLAGHPALNGTSGFVYTMPLVPNFLATLSGSTDLSKYTIQQFIHPYASSASLRSTDATRPSSATTVIYRFSYADYTQNRAIAQFL